MCFRWFCCGGSRPLTCSSRPSAASRHLSLASAGISCFQEVRRTNHPEVLRRLRQLRSAVTPVPPPPLLSSPSLSSTLPLLGRRAGSRDRRFRGSLPPAAAQQRLRRLKSQRIPGVDPQTVKRSREMRHQNTVGSNQQEVCVDLIHSLQRRNPTPAQPRK